MDWKGTQTAQDAGRDAIESHAEREAGDAVEEVEVDAVRDADVGSRGCWRPDVGDVDLPDHASRRAVVPKREREHTGQSSRRLTKRETQRRNSEGEEDVW